MPESPNPNPSTDSVQPNPPAEGTPLDETAAPIHYEGDTTSV